LRFPAEAGLTKSAIARIEAAAALKVDVFACGHLRQDVLGARRPYGERSGEARRFSR
jgi:hypothetical protein